MLVPKKIEAVDPVRLARASGMGRYPRPAFTIPPIPRPTLLTSQLSGCNCESGLGFMDMTTGTNEGNSSILGAVEIGESFIPAVGPIAASATQILSSALQAFKKWFGSGRAEADVIVPYQNQLVSQLGTITNQILIGANPSAATLDGLYNEVWQLAVGFMEYVSLRQFVDRRASGQALNTVMPYIDGTCGYPVPLPLRVPYPSQTGCLAWGDGTLGGPGTDGMLGAIGRAIQTFGGSIPSLPSIIDSANGGIKVSGGVVFPGTPGSPVSGVPLTHTTTLTAGLSSSTLVVGLGILALFMFSEKRGK